MHHVRVCVHACAYVCVCVHVCAHVPARGVSVHDGVHSLEGPSMWKMLGSWCILSSPLLSPSSHEIMQARLEFCVLVVRYTVVLFSIAAAASAAASCGAVF